MCRGLRNPLPDDVVADLEEDVGAEDDDGGERRLRDRLLPGVAELALDEEEGAEEAEAGEGEADVGDEPRPAREPEDGDDEGGNAGHLEGGEEGWGHRAEDTSRVRRGPARSRAHAATRQSLITFPDGYGPTWEVASPRASRAAAVGPPLTGCLGRT